jgi:hypothetical protein
MGVQDTAAFAVCREARRAARCLPTTIGPCSAIGDRDRRELSPAPVAQRIEHRPPEPVAQVRVLPGAPCPGGAADVRLATNRGTTSVLDLSPGWISLARLVTRHSDERDDDQRNGEGDDDPHMEDEQGPEQGSHEHGGDCDESSA